MQTNAVWKFLEDIENKKGITEIIINDVDKVFVEREGILIQLNIQFSLDDISTFILDVASKNQKECNSENPILDGTLPDGSRINIITFPFVQNSPSITIRKYLKSIKSFDQNPGCFGLTPSWIIFIKALVSSKMNVVVSGGTGVGKTTLLNLLLQEIEPKERIITIEDTIELSVSHPNSVRLEARQSSLSSSISLTINDLVKNTLRMRPDRIILGEVRGGELFDLLQAMNTGHEGSMTSLHANSSAECLDRMENLFLLSGFDLPYKVVRKQILTAVDFIIQITRDREGNRVISEITELTGMEGDTLLINTIAKSENGELYFSGFAPKRMELLKKRAGLSESFFDDSDIKTA